MEKIALTAQVRDKAGKGVARGLRRNNMVPAVLYSHGKSLPITMGNKEVMKVLKTEGGEHALITLKLDGAKNQTDRMALIKDYQVDPINGALIHVDLMEVAMNEKVRISVSVHISGTAAGVKEGGIFQYGQRMLDIECLPNQIPDAINADISALGVNESLHIRDIKAPEGVRILSDPDAVVATIQAPISAEKLEAMLTATPAVATEGGEPELVKKPKTEGAAETKGKEGAKEAAPKKEAGAKKEAAPKK